MLSRFVNRFKAPLPDCNTGLVESPVDDRDKLLSSSVYLPDNIPDELPPLFELSAHSQGQSPSCVGWTMSHIKEEKERRERIMERFDGEWIYARCKEIDGLPELRGTFFRSGLKVLQKQGAMPIGGGDPERFKIGSYARVDDDSFDGLKRAICVNGYLPSGYRLSRDGWRTADVRPPRSGEKVEGHATALVGYTRDRIIGLNSWGLGWGKNGYFYVPKDYRPIEAWAILNDLPTPPETGTTGWLAETFLENDKVAPVVGLRLRDGAGLGHNTIKTLPKGTKVEKLGGREFADGYWWVKVRVK